MTEQRKPKAMRRYSYDPGSTVVVEIGQTSDFGDMPVYHGGVLIGHIRLHLAQAEHPTHRGSRIVVRGKVFTAWAARPVGDVTKPRHEQPSYDYHAKHRSQAEAIRRLLSATERRTP